MPYINISLIAAAPLPQDRKDFYTSYLSLISQRLIAATTPWEEAVSAYDFGLLTRSFDEEVAAIKQVAADRVADNLAFMLMDKWAVSEKDKSIDKEVDAFCNHEYFR